MDRKTFIALRARRQGFQIGSELAYPELERPIPAAEPSPPRPPADPAAHPVAFVHPRELARRRSPVKLPSWLCHQHEPIQPDPDRWLKASLLLGAVVLLIAVWLIMSDPFYFVF